ncbi:MAG TPA: universal stress protein [Pirellulales bacterium]|jgi:universal stress protein E|nr:universal stress protein [Pirellulales bacterium]
MHFKNILLGIDLVQALHSGSAKFTPPVEQAIQQALWLAEKSQARLTFFSAMEVPDQDLYLSDDELGSVADKLHRGGTAVLAALVERAAARGIAAESKLATGAGWEEIIRQVLRGGHDLAIVGARDAGMLERLFFGSTARKLLHNCPCPVWVTHAGQSAVPKSILVGSDFSAVTDDALRAAAEVGAAAGATVHLLNAVDYPLDRLWSTGVMDYSSQTYHQQMTAQSKKMLAEQAKRVLGDHAGVDLKQHVTERRVVADSAILKFIKDHDVDLLVMGTMARSGIPGVFIGNTAERLASSVTCSLLAIKPADFECPISLAPLPAKHGGPYL